MKRPESGVAASSRNNPAAAEEPVLWELFSPEEFSNEEALTEEGRPNGSTPKELRANPAVPLAPEASRLRSPKREITADTEGSDETDAPHSPKAHWGRTKVEGEGVEVAQKCAYLFDVNERLQQERVGFLQVRLAAPRERKRASNKPPKKDGDKNLCFQNCSPEIQELLQHARAEEWRTWAKCNAGVALTQQEVNELKDAGVKINPTQWVETDKNAQTTP